MKPCSLLILAASALTLAGCSSTPRSVDHGAIHGRTFSFISRTTPVPANADNRETVHRAIQDSITKTLGSRGLAHADSGGDVTVRYLVITGNNASTERIDDYFGISDDASALHEKAQKAYAASDNPSYFQAGTLVIDLTDAKTFKLLKRGYITRPTLRELSEADRAARIQEAVDAILGDVQVAQ